MNAIHETAELDVLKKKSKKKKSTDSGAAAGENGNLQVGNESIKNKEKKEKDRSRKEKPEKDVRGLDMNGEENDHKKEMKKKKLKKKRSEMGDEGDDGTVDGDLEEVKEGEEQTQEDRQLKKSKKKKKMEAETEEKSASELVEEQGDRAREDEQVKKKKKHKMKERDHAGETDGVSHETVENVEPVPDQKRKKKNREEDSASHGEDTSSIGSKKKKKKSGKSKTESYANNGASASGDREHAAADCGKNHTEDSEMTKKTRSKEDKKSKKKKNKDKGSDCSQRNELNNEVDGSKGSEEKSRKNKKRKKAVETSEKSPSSKSSKKVRFSNQDEVFSLPDDSSKGKARGRDGNKSDDGLIRGKRFSKEEDDLLKKAVLDYVESHQLGEDGVHMVMSCAAYPEIRDCWKEIAEAIPWRPQSAIYYRGHLLFERSENCKWTQEELDLVKKFYEKHGAKWKQLADELGKHRVHVKDAWRRIKLPNKKNGHWSQEEYQTLFDLVNLDLKLKAFEEKKSKHGMLRDNIGWEAISEQLSTRTTPNCCVKWYDQLSSPLVADGKWADTDDYRLLIALVELDAACEEEVDWDCLLEHRSGEICRKRWKEMVRHIGEHGIKPFNEQVDILSKRYCPELLEPREIYANKPYVD